MPKKSSKKPTKLEKEKKQEKKKEKAAAREASREAKANKALDKLEKQIETGKAIDDLIQAKKIAERKARPEYIMEEWIDENINSIKGPLISRFKKETAVLPPKSKIRYLLILIEDEMIDMSKNSTEEKEQLKLTPSSYLHINGYILKNALEEVNETSNPLDLVLLKLIVDIKLISKWDKLNEKEKGLLWPILSKQQKSIVLFKVSNDEGDEEIVQQFESIDNDEKIRLIEENIVRYQENYGRSASAILNTKPSKILLQVKEPEIAAGTSTDPPSSMSAGSTADLPADSPPDTKDTIGGRKMKKSTKKKKTKKKKSKKKKNKCY